jgi:hypothetical protein
MTIVVTPESKPETIAEEIRAVRLSDKTPSISVEPAVTQEKLRQIAEHLRIEGREYMRNFGSAMDGGLWPEFSSPEVFLNLTPLPHNICPRCRHPKINGACACSGHTGH